MSDPETTRQSATRLIEEVQDHLRSLKEQGIRQVEVNPDLVRLLDRMPGPPPRAPLPPRAQPKAPAAEAERPPPPSGTDSMEKIALDVSRCTRCSLCKTRNQTVPGIGPMRPDIAFVGEGPGAEEDRQGLPFVGAAGGVLDRMLKRMGYERSDVWIGNIIKCRPPGNRNPVAHEMDACTPYLVRQLKLVQPRVIVCLGSTAVKSLLKTQSGISELRNHWAEFEGIPVMPTFHPAYLLHRDDKQAYFDVWEDLKKVLERLGRPVPTK